MVDPRVLALKQHQALSAHDVQSVLHNLALQSRAF